MQAVWDIMIKEFTVCRYRKDNNSKPQKTHTKSKRLQSEDIIFSQSLNDKVHLKEKENGYSL